MWGTGQKSMTRVARAGRDTSGADELARSVVLRIAKDEIPQFSSVARSFHAASGRQVRRAARRNEPLGIGTDGVTTMLSLAVMYVVSKLADSVLQRCADAAATTLTGRVRGWLGRLFRRGRPSPAEEAAWVPSPEELATVRAIAGRRARRLGLTEEQSDLIADGIVAELVTRAATSQAPEAADRTAGGADERGVGQN